MEIFSPAYPVNGTCFLTLNELIETSNKDECDKKEFIFHQGSYIISNNISFTHKHLVVRGTTNVIIKCVGPLKIKGQNIRIHNLQFQNCTNIIIQSSHKDKTIEITHSNFSASCLEFYFKYYTVHTALIIFNSTTFDQCNCTNETILYFGRPQTESYVVKLHNCLLYTSPSPRDATLYRMPSSA